jgi:hypothetical protein
MGKIAQEASLTENLPDGFRSTFLEAARLRKLYNANTGVLGDTVDEYSVNGTTQTISEQDVITSVADRVLTQYLLPERTLEPPGLALALENDGGASLLERFAARYKEDNDTPSGTIKDVARANTDDVVFQFATPEVFSQIANGDTSGPSNFQETGLGQGRVDLIGDQGIDTTANTNGSGLSLDDDEYLFLTGDYIDLSQGQSIVTSAELVDVDGEDFGHFPFVVSSRASGAHILTAQGTYATASIDVDVKAAFAGDAEVLPLAFYMAPGRKAAPMV